jgi:hypothetical protein
MPRLLPPEEEDIFVNKLKMEIDICFVDKEYV